MHSFLLQDWTTVRAASGIAAQSETNWLDLTGYEDVFVWVDVAAANAGGATITLTMETAPTKEDRLFVSLDDTFAVMALAVNTMSAFLPLRSGTVARPLSRYLRWKLSTAGGAAFSVTFRIHVVAPLAVPEETALRSARALRDRRLMGPWSTKLLDVVGLPSGCPTPAVKRTILMFGPDGEKAPVPKEWGLAEPTPAGCCCASPPPPKLEGGPK